MLLENSAQRFVRLCRRTSWSIVLIATASTTASFALVACQSANNADKSASGAADTTTSATPASASTARDWSPVIAHEYPGLHNLHMLPTTKPGAVVISGAQPEESVGFDSLAKLNVKTIISVDGARPDVELAAARGMRYIHIPVTYGTITREQQLALARAVRDHAEEGPIYIHCHHGKHRGPAALALTMVSLGSCTNEDALKFIADAGTSKSYDGLYKAVTEARELGQAEIDLAPADPPSIAPVGDYVSAMVAIDLAVEHLKVIEGAGWTTPATHPDLVPAAEAETIVETFRVLHARESERVAKNAALSQTLKAEYFEWMQQSYNHAASLRDGLVQNATTVPAPVAGELSASLASLTKTCTQCHTAYRN